MTATLNGHVQVDDVPPNLEESVEAEAKQKAGTKAKDKRPDKSPPSFAGIDGGNLAHFVDLDTDWLVDGIFAADQPTVFGAASKATKTTQLVDFSVALATQTPWLNSFSVSKSRKVLFITGESNYRGVSKRIQRALRSRSLDWSDIAGKLRVEAVEFPNFPSALDRQGIMNDVKNHGFEVVIIDPLYRGLQGLDTFRMAEMGEAIIQFVKACRPASVVISHHVIKNAARELGPPVLEDLSGAGLAESAGNWWLLGRNEPYKFDRRHDLSVVFGGRDEQAGIKRIVFDEIAWTFEVSCGQDIKEQRKRESAERKQQAEEAKIREARAGVKHALANESEARAKSWIESRSGHPQGVTRTAIAELLNDQTLIEQPYIDAKGRQQMGLILASMASETTAPEDAR